MLPHKPLFIPENGFCRRAGETAETSQYSKFWISKIMVWTEFFVLFILTLHFYFYFFESKVYNRIQFFSNILYLRQIKGALFLCRDLCCWIFVVISLTVKFNVVSLNETQVPSKVSSSVTSFVRIWKGISGFRCIFKHIMFSGIHSQHQYAANETIPGLRIYFFNLFFMASFFRFYNFTMKRDFDILLLLLLNYTLVGAPVFYRLKKKMKMMIPY